MQATERGTGIRDLRQAGSLKCLFPRQWDRACTAVLVNTAGGITGGDRFALTATAQADTDLTLTTQAAERAYRAGPGPTGSVASHLSVAAQARLNWLPQETILFDGSALSRTMRIEMAAGARLLFCEPLIFGRTAMDETLRDVRFHDRVEILREGQPLYLDAVRHSGDLAAHLDRPFVAGGARAMASLVYVAPDAPLRLGPVRALLPQTAGASLLAEDVLALRLLAADGYLLRQVLVPVLRHLYRFDPPRCWMI